MLSFSLSINHFLICFKVMPLSRKYIAFGLIALLYLHLVFLWTLPPFFFPLPMLKCYSDNEQWPNDMCTLVCDDMMTITINCAGAMVPFCYMEPVHIAKFLKSNQYFELKFKKCVKFVNFGKKSSLVHSISVFWTNFQVENLCSIYIG